MNEELPRWRRLLGDLGEPLQARRRRLEEEVAALKSDYPSAARFDDELDDLKAADAQLLDRLRETLGDAHRQAHEALNRHLSEPGELRLWWDDPAETLRLADTSLLPEFLPDILRDIRGPVAYPIVFSHEASTNHRAVAITALVVTVVDAAEGLVTADTRLTLEAGGRSIPITPDGAHRDDLPSPHHLGFVTDGELERRIRDFVDTDPEAHWQHWLHTHGEANEGCWSLRDPAGTVLTFLLDPDLRRLRVTRQAPSQVTRKRRHVFVDPVDATHSDRYFATAADAKAALHQTMQRRLHDGFRLVPSTSDP